MAETAVNAGIILTNALLAHVTWRALPEEHRHNVRKAARATRVVIIRVTRRSTQPVSYGERDGWRE